MKKLKLVSIVIPTYNEHRNIERCLTSIKNQSYQRVEVLIVDDASTDHTIILAKAVSKKIDLKISILGQVKHQERGVVRNLAARKAKGEFLLFIDADMELDRNVIESCIGMVNQKPKIKAIIIPEKSIGDGYWAKCRSLEKQCYIGDDSIEAARFINRRAFELVGGWSEGMIAGEDWDLSQRLRGKYEIGRVKDLIFHHEGRLSIFKVMRKKYYYATQSGKYLSQNKQSIKSFTLFVFRPAFFRNWRLFLSDPIIGIGVIFLKSVEILAGLAGLVVLKIENRKAVAV